MTLRSRHMGHDTVWSEGVQCWADTLEPIDDAPRQCNECALIPSAPLDDGTPAPDPCLGWRRFVAHACCGHGYLEDAYVMFPDGECWRGLQALRLLRQLPEMAP